MSMPIEIANGDDLGMVLFGVRIEREQQDHKWGEQNHPDGTGSDLQVMGRSAGAWSVLLRQDCQAAADRGDVTWFKVLLEEVFEAGAETDSKRLMEELFQIAAVCVAWIQAINRRSAHPDARTFEAGDDHIIRSVN